MLAFFISPAASTVADMNTYRDTEHVASAAILRPGAARPVLGRGPTR